MLIHVEKKIAFPLHATAASRFWENLLFKRGFKMIGSRHEGPRNLHTYIESPQMRAWWDSDPSQWSFAYMVRHHGDAMLTWWAQYKHQFPEANQEKVCPVFLEEFPKHQTRLFPCNRRMWRFVWDCPNAVTLRYELLRMDTVEFLKTFDLEPASMGELQRDPKHMTVGKPAGTWKEHYTPEALDLLASRYRHEMLVLGYRV